MKSKIILLLFSFTFSTVLDAQYQVTGEIYSPEMTPLANVNVILLRQDSTAIVGCVSDSIGRFVLNVEKTDGYLLSFSCLGYRTRVLVLPQRDSDFNVGRVVLDTFAHQLHEVEVLSKSSVRDKDRRIYYPTWEQLKYSTNGLTLLQQLSVPFLTVSLVENTVESVNGAVGLAINGKLVEMSEVLALRPEEILRVECIDYPGIRYGDVAMAINYVIKIKESGGLVGVELIDYPSGFHGSNDLFFKMNHGRSEFVLHYNNRFQDRELAGENRSVYRFPDRVIERVGKSKEYPWKMNRNQIKLNYNNRVQDKYYFNSTLSGEIKSNPGCTSIYNYEIKGESAPLRLRDSSGQKLKSSSLDLYLERQFKGNQTFVFNLVGSYHDSRVENTMRYEQNDQLLDDLNSSRKGDKYSLIGMVYYERRGTKTLSTLALKHGWFNVNSNYMFMHQKSCLSQHITAGCLSTMTNLNSWVFFVQGELYRIQSSEIGLSKTKWEYMLHGELAYHFSDHEGIVYALETESIVPTLSQMDKSEYAIDDRIVTKGNFHLKSAQKVKHRLGGQFDYGTFNFQVQAEYINIWDQISYVIDRETNRFVYKWDNQGDWRDIRLTYWMRWKITNWLLVNGSFTYHDIVSKGEEYRHKDSFFDYSFEMYCTYKSWMLSFSLIEQGNELNGETRSYAKKDDFLSIRYKFGNLNIGAAVYGFLGLDRRIGRQKVCNEWISSDRWNIGVRNQFALTLSYYFPWGKQKEGYNQRVKNEDTDRGIDVLK
ncbi:MULTISPECIES: carboxypeptidase-like regulatory domain-containing protein [unclassified Butyricimonas]|uniref:carboxypeptidase-like regulatory domain-containing protein n=1 Tax=unclassified Butyricimonas TaxID=2637652 RepID=UPI000C0765F8|nr:MULTISPECIES: carboxypeptidase-like regulatory domain-containing protein [unclassified Butyricimonas]